MLKRNFYKMFCVTVMFVFKVGLTQAADLLKPFTLASTGSGDVATVAADVKAKLGDAGFEIVGEYTPYADATIIIVTSDSKVQKTNGPHYKGSSTRIKKDCQWLKKK